MIKVIKYYDSCHSAGDSLKLIYNIKNKLYDISKKSRYLDGPFKRPFN